MKMTLGTLLLALSLGINANAFIFEPFASYETGDAGSDADLTGTAFGLRLGGSTLGFIYGAEYQTGTYEVEQGTTKADYDFSDIGAFVGYEFPILVRAYATYYFSHKADTDSTKLEGDGGMKLGVGYTGFPFIAINVEKMLRKYDKSNGASTDAETDTTMISLSIPLP